MTIGDGDWNADLSPPLQPIYILTMTLILYGPADYASAGSPLILAFVCPCARVAVGLQPSAFGLH